MFSVLSGVRPEERRPTFAAFAILLTFMVGHALLETARDALFLARIPAERLPWVYLLIAAVALVASQLQERFEHKLGGRRQLSGLFLSASLVTLALWFPLGGESGSVRALYAVYVWTGLLATLALIQFWSLMSDVFTVSQAKRLYALVGAGSVAGAIVGSGLAGLLAAQMDARHLLLGASAALFVTGLLAFFGLRAPTSEGDLGAGSKRSPRSSPGFFESAAAVLERPYPRRVALLVLTSTVGLTLADFLFKRTVAENVDPDELGTFFAGAYFALNVASLLVQVGLVGILVRRVSLRLTLSVLPALLILGSASFFAIGGIAAALLVKGPDGALRHSLHRTASELLYVPMASRRRRQLKAFIDVVGQRGGQALGSLAILGAVTALGAEQIPLALAGGLAALAFAWIVVAFELEPHYFELFRETLREGVLETETELPELDIDSLESWIAALDSPEDQYVLAGLDLLARAEKVELVPRLILYHPSAEVVERALGAFVAAGRSDFVAVADRVFERATPNVRAALLRARSVVAPDEGVTRELLANHTECPITVATCLVILVAHGWATDEDCAALEHLVEAGDPIQQYAAARAIRFSPHPDTTPLLVRMVEAESVEVLAEVAEAMGATGDVELLPHLLPLLRRRQLARTVSQAIVALGPETLKRLDQAMGEPDLSETLRRRLPAVMAHFAPAPAAQALLGHLLEERHDGMVRLKVLKALEQLRRYHPEVELERSVLDAAVKGALHDAYRWLALRASLEAGDGDGEATAVRKMLLRLLEGKEQHAIDRLLRLVGLLHPNEEVARIRRGLRSPTAEIRSSSRELLEKLATSSIRDALVSLIDDADRATRLAAAGTFAPRAVTSHVDALSQCLASNSVALRSLAAAYVGELGLDVLSDEVRALGEESSNRFGALVDRVLELLRGPSGAEEAVTEKPKRGDLAYET